MRAATSSGAIATNVLVGARPAFRPQAVFHAYHRTETCPSSVSAPVAISNSTTKPATLPSVSPARTTVASVHPTQAALTAKTRVVTPLKYAILV